jgi:hypothetical protein
MQHVMEVPDTGDPGTSLVDDLMELDWEEDTQPQLTFGPLDAFRKYKGLDKDD